MAFAHVAVGITMLFMVSRSINLKSINRLIRQYRQFSGIHVTLFVSLGLAMLSMLVSICSVGGKASLLIAAALLPIAYIIVFYITKYLRGRLDGLLRAHIGANLIEHGLLLAVLQDDAAERLPALKRRQVPGLTGGMPAGSFMGRLKLLCEYYRNICLQAGLKPFPVMFVWSIWLSFIGTVICVIGVAVLLTWFRNPLAYALIRLSVGSFGLILLGIHMLLEMTVRYIVADELRAAFAEQECP